MLKGVYPAWEDPINISGGQFVFRIRKEDGLNFWKECLMAAVSGQSQNHLRKNDFITGVSIVARSSEYFVQIWHSKSEKLNNEHLLDYINKWINN
jgi:hypothetical protein